MAGMLPGVESARRRRLRGWSDQASVVGSGLGSARIRVFNHTQITPTSFLMVNQSDEDDKLGGAAREAKERLDGRLRGHLKQDIVKRQNNQETLSSVERRSSTTPMAMEDLQTDIFRSKEAGLERCQWGKKWLRWKSSKESL